MGFYEEAFERNIGVFSKKEQNIIKNLRIAIAGCGGMGGQAAQQLVRTGVENFKVADFDSYNTCNLNNQFDSNSETIGKNKAEVVVRNLTLINPYVKVECFRDGVTTKNVEKFLENIDVVVDAIDYNNQVDCWTLHKEARKRKLYTFTSQAIGLGASLLVFDPKGLSLEEYLGEEAVKSNLIPVEKFSPYLPTYADPKVVKNIVTGDAKYLPNVATAQCLGIAMMVGEILQLVIKKQKPICAPGYMAIDLWDRKFLVKK